MSASSAPRIVSRRSPGLYGYSGFPRTWVIGRGRCPSTHRLQALDMAADRQQGVERRHLNEGGRPAKTIDSAMRQSAVREESDVHLDVGGLVFASVGRSVGHARVAHLVAISGVLGVERDGVGSTVSIEHPWFAPAGRVKIPWSSARLSREDRA